MNKEQIVKKSLSATKYTVVFRVLSQATSLVVTVLLVRALSEHDSGLLTPFSDTFQNITARENLESPTICIESPRLYAFFPMLPFLVWD